MGTKSLGPPFTVRSPAALLCLQDTGIVEGTGQLSSGTVLCVCVIVHSQDNLQITLGTDKIGGWLCGLTHRTRVWVVAPPRPFPLKVPQVPPIRTPYLLPITPTSSPDPIPDFSLRNSPLSFSETSPQPKVPVLCTGTQESSSSELPGTAQGGEGQKKTCFRSG